MEHEISQLFTESSNWFYYITSYGRVYRIKKADWKPNRTSKKYYLKPYIDTYRNVLYVKANNKNWQVKKLVLNCFSRIALDKNSIIVNKDENPANCFINNLEVVSRKSLLKTIAKKGASASKVKIKVYNKIKKTTVVFESLRDCAKGICVSERHFRAYLNNQNKFSDENYKNNYNGYLKTFDFEIIKN